MNIVEGESLVNDATALVAYRVAVAAAVGGSFSALDAGLEFVGAAAGGIAIGLVVGFVVAEIRRRLDDAPTEITISLLTAYAAFIPADALNLSGVLAAVTARIYLGWRGPELVTPQTRLQSFAVWEILVFLLNATLFILIGLQLPMITDSLGAYTTGELVGYSALVCATVIGARFAFMSTMPYVVRALDRRPAQRERRVGWRPRIVSAWAGMRGAVSLAAALALPLETMPGATSRARPDPVHHVRADPRDGGRPGFVTAVPDPGPGGEEDGAEEVAEEGKARWIASRAALDRLDELAVEEWTLDDTIERLRGLYQFRQRRVKVRAGKIEDEDGIENRSLAYQRLMHELYTVQRRAVVELRNSGEISNDVMHRIERELDLEESRLEV